MLSLLKHTSKGATEATLVMFLAADSLIKDLVTALKIEDSRTVYGFTVLIFVPPLPWLSIDSNVAFNGTVLSLILIDLTPMKYSAEGSPWLKAEAVLTGLMKSGVKESDWDVN
jgi:hypothetical protein